MRVKGVLHVLINRGPAFFVRVLYRYYGDIPKAGEAGIFFLCVPALFKNEILKVFLYP